MKLVGQWDYASSPRQVSVGEAVRRTLTSREGEGRIEDLEHTLQNAEDFLGDLTQILHGKGLLTDSEVLSLCRGFKLASD